MSSNPYSSATPTSTPPLWRILRIFSSISQLFFHWSSARSFKGLRYYSLLIPTQGCCILFSKPWHLSTTMLQHTTSVSCWYVSSLCCYSIISPSEHFNNQCSIWIIHLILLHHGLKVTYQMHQAEILICLIPWNKHVITEIKKKPSKGILLSYDPLCYT